VRLALFGSGSLSLDVATRDGSVSDRRELCRGFDQLDVEWVYVAPQRHTPDEPRVVGYDWRGPVDLLAVEARRPSFDGGVNDRSTPNYHQWRVITDWHRGLFGHRCRLVVIDFGMNIREVFGLGAPKGTPHHAVPGAEDAAEADRANATFLTPCNPALMLSCGDATVVRWLWPYPVEDEVEPAPFLARTWNLTYAGSDYQRRRKYVTYYATAAQAGVRVATAGSWTATNKGSAGRLGSARDEAYGGTNFRQKMEAAGVTFVGEGKGCSPTARFSHSYATPTPRFRSRRPDTGAPATTPRGCRRPPRPAPTVRGRGHQGPRPHRPRPVVPRLVPR
jgi:hypothetical protein